MVAQRSLVRLLAAALFVAAPKAQAEESPVDTNHSPFRVHVPLDLGVSLGAMLIGALPRLLVNQTLRPWCGGSCNPADVNAFDRTAIGYHSAVALQVADAGFFTSMAIPFAADAIDVLATRPSDGILGGAKDWLVMGETLSITLAVNNVMSFIVRRPRPRAYDPSLTPAERDSPNNTLSFYSGHTAVSFAMATAYSRIFMERHPRSPLVAPVWIRTYLIATARFTLSWAERRRSAARDLSEEVELVLARRLLIELAGVHRTSCAR
jgi:hypothetical protein